jgi:toxoflavin biosynthesis protein ToxC
MLRHISPISGIASYAGQYIATAGYDNRVILWDAKNNFPVAVGNHDHLANQCEFSQCGKYLVTSSSDHTARIWLIPQMKLIAVLSDHDDDVEYAALHPKELLVATASRDCKIRIFDFKGRLLNTITGHDADVISIQWLGASKKLISSSDDGTIRVWDVESGIQIDQLNDSGVQTDALAISNEGIIYAGDDTGEVHVISKNIRQQIGAHQAGIKKIVLQGTNKKLISIAYDRKACLWDILSTGELKLCVSFSLPNVIWARSCAFHGDTEIVFSTFGDTYARYDYQSGKWQADHINGTSGINAVLADASDVWTVGDAGVVKKNYNNVQQLPSLCNFLIKCGSTVLTGGQTGEIFSGASGNVIYRHRSPLNCAASFTYKNENYIIVGAYTGEGVILKQHIDGSVIYHRTITLHDNAIKGLAVNDDILFSVCATGAAAWHDLKNDKQLKYVKGAHQKIANGCVALEGKHFASVSRDLFLRIWNGNDLSLECEMLTPHTRSIKCIATDTSFRYLATGSYNGTVAIFDRKKSYWQTKRITNAGISSLFFNKTNNQFLASSYDGNIHSLKGISL